MTTDGWSRPKDTMNKFALVSVALPPSQSGQSMVLYHLCKTIPAEDYCLITMKNFHLYRYLRSCSARLPARYHFLHPDYQIMRLMIKTASLLSARPLLSLLLKIRVHQIKIILKKEHVRVVVACSGELFDPPAAFIAARDLGIPYVLYAFDHYSRQWNTKFTRSFAEEYEHEILQKAMQVIVPNECMAEDYSRQYGISPVIIHNPFDLEEYEKNMDALPAGMAEHPKKPDEIRIIYTGAVYDAHYTAFHNLIAAIPKTGIPGLTLHIYTPQSIGQLLAHGITGPVTIHKPLPNSEMPAVHRSADILFLPLAFGSPYPDIIRTSAPAKIGEYLASKRPVLVHAPKDSFISWYFKKFECGYVVEEDSPDDLAGAITDLLTSKEKQKTLSENAYACAVRDFDVRNERKKFCDIFRSQK
jgi:glycosyltransferase involved in cell wall biosynthesis